MFIERKRVAQWILNGYSFNLKDLTNKIQFAL